MVKNKKKNTKIPEEQNTEWSLSKENPNIKITVAYDLYHVCIISLSNTILHIQEMLMFTVLTTYSYVCISWRYIPVTNFVYYFNWRYKFLSDLNDRMEWTAAHHNDQSH